MKKKSTVITLIACTMAVMGLFHACQKGAFEPNPEVVSKYDEVGRLHNEGLAYVLESIKGHNLKTKASGTNTDINVAMLEDVCRDFLDKKGILPQTRNGENDDKFVKELPDLKTLGLADNTLKYMTRFKNGFLNRKLKTIEDVETFIDNIERKIIADKSLTEQDREALLCMTSVGRYSANYWNENYLDWMIEIKGLDQSIRTFSLTKSDSESAEESSWWNDLLEVALVDAGAAGVAALRAAATGPVSAVAAIAWGLGGSILEAFRRLIF